MEFKQLIVILDNIHQGLQEQGVRAVNTYLTLRNWFFGLNGQFGSTVSTKQGAPQLRKIQYTLETKTIW